MIVVKFKWPIEASHYLCHNDTNIGMSYHPDGGTALNVSYNMDGIGNEPTIFGKYVSKDAKVELLDDDDGSVSHAQARFLRNLGESGVYFRLFNVEAKK